MYSNIFRVATTLELSFPQSVINLQTTTNNAEVETFLNTKIVDGIQNQAPTFNLKVESLPDNVRVFVKKEKSILNYLRILLTHHKWSVQTP